MNIFDSIQRPTLLLDAAAARRNIRRMAEKARSQNVRFRPHFKTHQSAAIGEWFRAEGVSAITVSSVEMAQYFAAHGWKDITIAFPLNMQQMDAVRRLASQVHLELLIESVESAEFLDQHVENIVDVWIKVDVGAGRTGLPWDEPHEVIELANCIRALPGLNLRGLLTHAGQTYHAGTPEELVAMFMASNAHMRTLKTRMEETGIKGLEISVGDTPGCSLSGDFCGVDEVRPGNFVFYDAMQLSIGSCHAEEVAVAVACPVVAKHDRRHQVILYGGSIHLSSEHIIEDGHKVFGYVCLPEGKRWGAPLPGAFVASLSQEHGVVTIPSPWYEALQVGGLVCVLPAHSCITAAAMKKYLTLEGEVIETMG